MWPFRLYVRMLKMLKVSTSNRVDTAYYDSCFVRVSLASAGTVLALVVVVLIGSSVFSTSLVFSTFGMMIFSVSSSSSSGVDSLIEIIGGGGGILFDSSSVVAAEDTLVALLLSPLAMLVVFLLLPLGAGSRFGVVRLYMNVRFTTSRTVTGLLHALLGVVGSNMRAAVQSAGEKGEYKALGRLAIDNAVRGVGPVAVAGEKVGECRVGILSF